MKKSLLLAAGFACLISTTALADCICGTMGCESCDSAEDYLEDVGQHLKKQSRKIKKHTRMICQENTPAYWEEDVTLIGKNAAIILDYAEMLDDEVVMTPEQKQQAKTDALQLKSTGQKIKDKATDAKKKCQNMNMETGQAEIPTSANRLTLSKQGKKHKQHLSPYTDMMLIENMENNGDMLIQVGDFMLENIAK